MPPAHAAILRITAPRRRDLPHNVPIKIGVFQLPTALVSPCCSFPFSAPSDGVGAPLLPGSAFAPGSTSVSPKTRAVGSLILVFVPVLLPSDDDKPEWDPRRRGGNMVALRAGFYVVMSPEPVRNLAPTACQASYLAKALENKKASKVYRAPQKTASLVNVAIRSVDIFCATR